VPNALLIMNKERYIWKEMMEDMKGIQARYMLILVRYKKVLSQEATLGMRYIVVDHPIPYQVQ
jgi:hypothetical protein